MCMPRPCPTAVRRTALGLALCVLSLGSVFALRVVNAQSGDIVYASSDLEVPPRIAVPTAASRALQDAYPDALRRAGIGGVVQLQFVVGTSGKVEASSVEVIESPAAALSAAAKRAVARVEFKPGMHHGVAVRSRVLLPVEFKSER